MEFKLFKNKPSTEFQTVAIIEEDTHFLQIFASYCWEFGFKEVHCFSSCDDAWPGICKGSYSLVILDWFTKKGEIRPMSLFNRVKNSNLAMLTPFVVSSGHPDRHDFRLVREFPLCALVEKPFTSGVIFDAFESLQSEYNWYRANMKKIRKIIDGPQKKQNIRKHLKFIIERSPDLGNLAALYGKALRISGLFKESEEVLRWAIGEKPDHVALLNEIGKLYHTIGRHTESLKYLRRAGTLSPQNTRRLCLIGELQIGEKNFEASQESFSEALAIDPNYSRAVDGLKLCKVAAEHFGDDASEIVTNTTFASMMNTIGINKVRSGHLEEGLDHYRSALNFIDNRHNQSKVMFNIALAFFRNHRIRDALLWFMRASKSGGVSKADKYVRQLSSVFILADKEIKEPSTNDHEQLSPIERAMKKKFKGGKDVSFSDFHDDDEKLFFHDDDTDLLVDIGDEALLG